MKTVLVSLKTESAKDISLTDWLECYVSTGTKWEQAFTIHQCSWDIDELPEDEQSAQQTMVEAYPVLKLSVLEER